MLQDEKPDRRSEREVLLEIFRTLFGFPKIVEGSTVSLYYTDTGMLENPSQ